MDACGFKSHQPHQPIKKDSIMKNKAPIKSILTVPPQFIKVAEQNRTYHFPNGSITLKGVDSINVSKSGTHRINTTDGRKHIIPTGWLHIEFDASKWTF